MIRTSPRQAFTLIEMLTVMAIIAILAGLILATSGYAQTKAGRSRADSEIHAIAAGIENYKADNGTIPRSDETDSLDPRVDGSSLTGSSATRYQKASLYLYSALNNDFTVGDQPPAGGVPNKDQKPDFRPEGKSYLPEFFKPNNLSTKKDNDGHITEVYFMLDPFGGSYGYSTAGAKAEDEFQAKLRTDPSATRPTSNRGYNATYDLWSTGGSNKGTTDLDQQKWIKNW